MEPSVIDRVVATGSQQALTSFAWHQHDENRFLSISVTGAMTDYTVFDRITLNWAANSNIAWTYGRKTMKYINENSSLHTNLDDIADKIKRRTLNQYGLKVRILNFINSYC